jgi:hypothetical protein
MEKLIKFRLGRKVRNRLTNLIEKEITPFEQKRTKSNYVHSSDVANWKQQIKEGYEIDECKSEMLATDGKQLDSDVF